MQMSHNTQQDSSSSSSAFLSYYYYYYYHFNLISFFLNLSGSSAVGQVTLIAIVKFPVPKNDENIQIISKYWFLIKSIQLILNRYNTKRGNWTDSEWNCSFLPSVHIKFQSWFKLKCWWIGQLIVIPLQNLNTLLNLIITGGLIVDYWLI